MCTSTDTDECEQTLARCGNHAICINTIGSFYCLCEPGYKERSNKKEFNVLNGQCLGTNFLFTFLQEVCMCLRLLCWPMTFLSMCVSSTHGVTDINECLDIKDICGPNAYCNNTIGNYTCICGSGYAKLHASSGKCNGGICLFAVKCRVSNCSSIFSSRPILCLSFCVSTSVLPTRHWRMWGSWKEKWRHLWRQWHL